MKIGNLIASAAAAPVKKNLKALGVTDVAGALAAHGEAVKAKLKGMGIKDPDSFLKQHGASLLKQVGQEPSKAQP